MSRFFRGAGAAFALAVLCTACAHHSKSGASGSGELVSAYDGGAIYRQQCSTCHGVRGEGVAGVAPGLRLGAALDTPAALVAVARGERGNGVAMPGWCAVLSDREIADVVAYIRVTWGARPRPPRLGEVATACGHTARRGAR